MKALIYLFSLSLLLINPPAVADQPISLDPVQQPLPEHLRLGVPRDGWMPFIGSADNLPLEGISGEAIDGFAQLEGVSIEVVPFDSFEQLLDALRRGEIDFTSDVIANRERRLYFRFTQPYSHSHHGIIINHKSRPIFALEELAGKTVAIEAGSYHASELQIRYPKIRLAQVSSAEDALRAVSAGLADAYVGNLEVANYLINSQQISGLRVSTALQSDLRALRFAVREDLPALEQALNRFIETGQQAENFDHLWVKWTAYQAPALNNSLIPYRGHQLALATAVLLILGFLLYRLRKLSQLRDRAQLNLELILEHSNLGIIQSNSNREIHTCSQRAARDIGLSSQELEGYDLYHLAGSQLLNTDLSEPQRQQLLRAILNNQPISLRLTKTDRIFDLRHQPLPDGGGLLTYHRLLDQRDQRSELNTTAPEQANSLEATAMARLAEA